MKTTSAGILIDGSQKSPLIIPSPDHLKPYKAEFPVSDPLLAALADIYNNNKFHSGIKVNTWFGPDPRPHNHPWSGLDDPNDGIAFESTVLQGWLFHKVWKVYPQIAIGGAGTAKVELVREEKLEAGQVYTIAFDEYHEVTEIWTGDKGQPTATLMRLGRVVGDGKQWGNLNIETGEVAMVGTKEFNAMDPTFLDRLLFNNRYMKDPRPPKAA